MPSTRNLLVFAVTAHGVCLLHVFSHSLNGPAVSLESSPPPSSFCQPIFLPAILQPAESPMVHLPRQILNCRI